MIKKLTHLTLFVHNQEDSLNFYTHKLGFKVHTDMIDNNGARWLTVCLPENPDFELILMPAINEFETSLVGQQGNTMPLACFSTDNCQKTYEELKAKGVEFTQNPLKQPWRINAIFKDLYGTLFNLVEPLKE